MICADCKDDCVAPLCCADLCCVHACIGATLTLLRKDRS